MADSPIFDWLCAGIEQRTDLSAIEARGTVRIALKKSGVTAGDVTPVQMQVVVKRVLPEELSRRGCADTDTLCSELARSLMDQCFEQDDRSESPEDVFARLGS